MLYDRRTVLRATAGSATGMAAVFSAAGTASASHFKPGDCVVTTESVGSYPECNGLISYPVDDGKTGRIKQECSESNEYYVDWDDQNAEDGWVDGGSLDHC